MSAGFAGDWNIQFLVANFGAGMREIEVKRFGEGYFCKEGFELWVKDALDVSMMMRASSQTETAEQIRLLMSQCLACFT